MTRTGSTIAAVALLIAGLGVSACSSAGTSTGSSGASSAAATATGTASAAPPAAGTSAAAPSTPAATTKAVPPTQAAPPVAGRSCTMIDLAAATALLGITPTQMAAPVSTDGDDDGVKLTKLDGCSYIGDPSLGYDVNKFEGGMPVTQYLAGARAELGARPGVTPMEVTLGDAAVGFTSAVGSKTMARIEVAKGSTLVSVSSVATDAAKAKAIAVEGATRLVAAIG